MKYSVYTMYMPYPNKKSKLAITSHMYILFKNNLEDKETYWLKIQSYKLLVYLNLQNKLLLSREQFTFLEKNSILDLDKVFIVKNKDFEWWNLLKKSRRCWNIGIRNFFFKIN